MHIGRQIDNRGENGLSERIFPAESGQVFQRLVRVVHHFEQFISVESRQFGDGITDVDNQIH